MDQKDAPSHESFTLSGGETAIIRPIRPEDAPLLQEFVLRLSPETVYFRFLEFLKGLSDQQAQQLANIDYDSRMAFVACTTSDPTQIIGVARYHAAGQQDKTRAEVGVVVEDLYQSQGLGTRLLALLIDYAAAHGIRFLTASVSPANSRVLKFIESSRLPYRRRFSQGVWEVEVELNSTS